MPTFKVAVTSSDNPQEAREALDRAGIPTIGPAFAHHVGSPEGGKFGPRMAAVFEADTEDAAVARVREVVGAECQVELSEVTMQAPPPSDRR
jgi:hypothetical protein